MSNFNEYSGSKKGVGGWLLLLCFALTIGSPLMSLYNMYLSYSNAYIYFDQFPGFRNICYIDIVLSLVLVVLSIRAGLALWRIQPGAVKIAKKYFLYLLGYSLISICLPFMAGLPVESNAAMIPVIVKGTFQTWLFIGIWYSYLTMSKRVEATYFSDSLSEKTVSHADDAEILDTDDQLK